MVIFPDGMCGVGKFRHMVTCDMPFAVVGKSSEEIEESWEDSRTPWLNWPVYELTICYAEVGLAVPITVLEPTAVCGNAEWDGVRGTLGCAGQICMNLYLYVEPLVVSFDGIFMVEIPDDVAGLHDGYFNDSDTNKTGALSHTLAAGAGVWTQVHGSEWALDRVGRRTVYPQPWVHGWKEWPIPVGWGDLFHSLKGQCQPNPTVQRFSIEADGSAKVSKYGHVIERRTNNDVYLDDVLQE